ncbi:MAG: hemolysin family protein [Lachnospiraceae bacterium]|nr:hemolysin family protein [Lachnospiraceae bacterium]
MNSVVLGIIINDLILGIIAGVILIFRGKSKNKAAEEDIISMVNESLDQGYIEDNEAFLINNIFEFGDKSARDIMTDRSNIIAIESGTLLSEAMEFMLDSGHSRFPVYDSNLDTIAGILHIKDAMSLLRDKENENKCLRDIDGIYREVRCIPETRKVDALFTTMQSQKLQMVIVVDEYGQTAGLIAMEDILEEIVGNISDEYDDDDGHIIRDGDSKFIVRGSTPLEDLKKKLGIEFEVEDIETINGYMISRMEKIPDKKCRFETRVGDYIFKVLEVDHNMIKQVLVYRDDNEREDLD